MNRLINLTGMRFGRLVVLNKSRQTKKDGKPMWDCLCDCGKFKTARGATLRNGRTTSCGCYATEVRRETQKQNFYRHGKSTDMAYGSWAGMMHRCYDPENSAWPYYGARGIKVCGRWRDSFDAFLEDMGPRPSRKHTIDRVNNDGDYTPGNCRWATKRQQAQNRSNNVLIKWDDEVHCASEWARREGVKRTEIMKWLHNPSHPMTLVESYA